MNEIVITTKYLFSFYELCIESPIEEVTDALSGKGIQFLMTHDIELKLPEILFNGATFRISPRSFEGNGALVKLEFMPKTSDALETGRIFFKKMSKSPYKLENFNCIHISIIYDQNYNL